MATIIIPLGIAAWELAEWGPVACCDIHYHSRERSWKSPAGLDFLVRLGGQILPGGERALGHALGERLAVEGQEGQL